MLLAIDTSTRVLGVALYDGVVLHSEILWTSLNHHSVELAPAVDQALSRAGLRVTDLQVVGVARGPGSFTSLRVGLAFAKGLVLAHHVPLVALSTLDVVARAQPVQDIPLAAVLQAGRGRLAVGWYRAEEGVWKSQGPLSLLTPQELSDQVEGPTAICGELTAESRRILGRKYKSARLASPAQSARRAGFLAEMAWERWRAGETDNPATLAPIYLQHTAAA